MKGTVIEVKEGWRTESKKVRKERIEGRKGKEWKERWKK